jgi:nitrogen PTS system EIIA component
MIHQLVHPTAVWLDIEPANAAELLTWAGTTLGQLSAVPAATITKYLTERENLGSTGLGKGVAVPHGRIKGLKQVQLSVVRTTKPIDFSAVDGIAVNLFFFILLPDKAIDQHLVLLSELAQLLSNTANRQAMLTAKNADEIVAIIKAVTN